MELIFATGNKNKLREAQDVLKGCKVIGMKLDIPEIQGSEEEVVRDKAQRAYDVLKKPVFVDDTSLHMHALRGLPGVYTVHFIDRIGTEGVYKLLEPYDDKRASAISYIGYHDGKEIHLFKGESHGVIVPPSGKNFFGFDPIFQPEGTAKTYAEMALEEKNVISHRAQALRKFKDYLLKT